MQFSRFLKVSRDGAEVTLTSKSFHVRAPATRKARRATVGSLTAGTSRWSDEEDLHLFYYCTHGCVCQLDIKENDDDDDDDDDDAVFVETGCRRSV